MKLHLELKITETPPPNCLGILWPVSPNTHFQRTVSTAHDAQMDCRLDSTNIPQQAYFRALSETTPLPEIQYLFELGTYAPIHEQFTLNQTNHLTLTDDVYQCINTILGQPQNNPQQFVQDVVTALAKHFDYIHHDDELNRAELVCTHLQGDCLDINTALMKILKTQGIPSAYYIGMYFEAPHHPIQNDWHCWVSTNITQIQDWDIAHHIKRGLKPVNPALNPIAGVRCALSHGRGAQFKIQGKTYDFSHLGSPFWCLNDGMVRQAAFQARVKSLSPALEAIC